MAGNVRALVQWDNDSGLPEDVTVNVWHFRYSTLAPTDSANVRDMLQDFYGALDPYLAENLAGTGTLRLYDLSDPEPRQPFAGYAMTLTPGTSNLPSEVSLCMSFQGDPTSGQPQARRRGRVYIGPLSDDALASATGRPAELFVTALVNAGQALLDASQASATWDWIVWSPTAASQFVVTNGWVDNEFDTQRRRGLRATGRSTFA